MGGCIAGGDGGRERGEGYLLFASEKAAEAAVAASENPPAPAVAAKEAAVWTSEKAFETAVGTDGLTVPASLKTELTPPTALLTMLLNSTVCCGFC